MKRGTLFLILFVLIAAGVIGASQFLRNQPPLNLTLVVDPLAADWAQAMVKQFNDSNALVNNTRRVEVKVAVVSDLDIWRDKKSQPTPYAWLPSSSLSVAYARDNSLPFTVVKASVARTPLVWGGYASYVSPLTQNGTVPLDWQVIQNAAKMESWVDLGMPTDGGFVRLAFDPPQTRMSGVGMLLTGAAAFKQTPDLKNQSLAVTDLYNWMQPVALRDFITSGDGMDNFIRGPSSAQLALLPENQWLTNWNELPSSQPVRFSYPAYQFMFDFPLAVWDDAQTTSDYRAAVQVFGDWLLAPAQQTSAATYGLRPVSGEPGSDAALFKAATASGIQLNPNYGQTVTAPSRNEAQGLIQWFTSQR